jgi:hypothetical protein
MHDTAAFFLMHVREWKEGVEFTPPRGGEREGRWVFPDPGGFSGFDFFDYWELGVRVIFLFGDRILDLVGLCVSTH